MQPLEQAILHMALARAAVALAEMQLCAVGASNSAASCQPEKVRCFVLFRLKLCPTMAIYGIRLRDIVIATLAGAGVTTNLLCAC